MLTRRFQHFFRIAFLWIRQEAYSNNGTNDNRSNNHPKRRLFIVQNRLHACLDTNFSKGQWTGCNHPAVYAADEQRLRIGLFVRGFHGLNHLFIAGQLDVTGEQDVCYPDQRIEPIYREQKESKWFPPVVMPLQMRLLMGDHIGRLLLCHSGRHINARAEHSENKR